MAPGQREDIVIFFRDTFQALQGGWKVGDAVLLLRLERFAGSAMRHSTSQWGVGLSVMLEKIAGIALVNKLRAILLMEADFNMHNRIIFGSRMIEAVRKQGLIPEETFSSAGTTAEDGSFQKQLVYDISRQSRTACTNTSNDAASL